MVRLQGNPYPHLSLGLFAVCAVWSLPSPRVVCLDWRPLLTREDVPAYSLGLGDTRGFSSAHRSVASLEAWKAGS